MKHTILFLAANPLGTDRLALDEECAAIERELRMSAGRDDFDFRSKWAVSVDELMRHLNELGPTIVHFSGHGSDGTGAPSPADRASRRDVESPRGAGILLQDERRSQYVSERALAKMIASASPSTRVVVLNACHSAAIAESLRHEVGCVVGMDSSIGDDAARSFAVAFYRALGNRRSVGNAIAQAVATLDAKQHADAHPICMTHPGTDAHHVFLSTSDGDPPAAASKAAPAPASHERPGSPQTEERPVTREALLTQLSKLLPSQFEEVLYRAKIPLHHLPGAGAAQATRAIEVLRYVEQQGQLGELARIIEQVLHPR
jgi:CHAT domain